MNRRRFLALSAAFACAPALAQAATWQGRALGAEVSVTLSGPRAATARALSEIPAALDRIEALFSLHRPGSALSRLNATGRLSPVPAPFRALVMQAGRAHRLTGGLFDPTIQPLWRALAAGHDPAPARALIGWHRLTITPGAITLAPGQQLTFNGIAQGFATDLIRTRLRAQGFTRALVDIGEQASLGGPHRIGLEDPTHGALGHRTLSGGAIATSSPAALRLGAQTHILNPQGHPPLWSSVSIEAPSATCADAFSTAAVFLPKDALRTLRRRAGLTRITTVDPQGRLSTL